MFDIEKLISVLDALPDPAFILSSSGKYVAIFGGHDSGYYHDGNSLVGSNIADVVKEDKARWFLEKIELSLSSKDLLVEEYELSVHDIKGIPVKGPDHPIWFEARIQALDFQVDGEGVVLWIASNMTRRHDLEVKLREYSDTDQLTGLYNRRKLEQELRTNFDIFQRHSVPISILMFDLDNFKIVNDTHGHHAGDEVIMTVAKVCREELRKTDVACRFGGDEFVIVLPNIAIDMAVAFASRLHGCFNMALSQLAIDGSPLTVSIGASAMNSSDISYEYVLKRADRALYEAKRSGRNQVFSG